MTKTTLLLRPRSEVGLGGGVGRVSVTSQTRRYSGTTAPVVLGIKHPGALPILLLLTRHGAGGTKTPTVTITPQGVAHTVWATLRGCDPSTRTWYSTVIPEVFRGSDKRLCRRPPFSGPVCPLCVSVEDPRPDRVLLRRSGSRMGPAPRSGSGPLRSE